MGGSVKIWALKPPRTPSNATLVARTRAVQLQNDTGTKLNVDMGVQVTPNLEHLAFHRPKMVVKGIFARQLNGARTQTKLSQGKNLTPRKIY